MPTTRTYLTDRVVAKDNPQPVPAPPGNLKMTEQTQFETDVPNSPVPPTPTESTASAAQVAANRKNAKLSSGPKTAQGKAICARNPIKHGLYARDLLLKSPHHTERIEDYKKLVDSLFEELKPETLFQEHLVRKIANCLWRSRRAVIAETAHINHQLADVDSEVRSLERRRKILFGEDSPNLTKSEKRGIISEEVSQCLVPDRDTSTRIVWYEMRLDRQLARAYTLLNSLKSRPAPADPEPAGAALDLPPKSGSFHS